MPVEKVSGVAHSRVQSQRTVPLPQAAARSPAPAPAIETQAPGEAAAPTRTARASDLSGLGPAARAATTNAAARSLYAPDGASGQAPPSSLAALLRPNAIRRELEAVFRDAAALKAGASAAVAAEYGPPDGGTYGGHYGLRYPLTALDGGVQIDLDLYAAQTGAREWQVVVYREADSSADGGFPYSAPPLASYRLAVDPASGAILACLFAAAAASPAPARLFDPSTPVAMKGLAAALALASAATFAFSRESAGVLLMIAVALALVSITAGGDVE